MRQAKQTFNEDSNPRQMSLFPKGYSMCLIIDSSLKSCFATALYITPRKAQKLELNSSSVT